MKYKYVRLKNPYTKHYYLVLNKKEEQEFRNAIWKAIVDREEFDIDDPNEKWRKKLVMNEPLLTVKVDVYGHALTFEMVASD